MLPVIFLCAKSQFLHCKLEVIAQLLTRNKGDNNRKFLEHCLAHKISHATDYDFCYTLSKDVL